MKMVQSCQRSRVIRFECDHIKAKREFHFLKAQPLTGNVSKPNPQRNDRKTNGRTL